MKTGIQSRKAKVVDGTDETFAPSWTVIPRVRAETIQALLGDLDEKEFPPGEEHGPRGLL